MNPNKLMDALNDIDDRWIKEAEPGKRRGSAWRRSAPLLAVAAMLALTVSIGSLSPLFRAKSAAPESAEPMEAPLMTLRPVDEESGAEEEYANDMPMEMESVEAPMAEPPVTADQAVSASEEKNAAIGGDAYPDPGLAKKEEFAREVPEADGTVIRRGAADNILPERDPLPGEVLYAEGLPALAREPENADALFAVVITAVHYLEGGTVTGDDTDWLCQNGLPVVTEGERSHGLLTAAQLLDFPAEAHTGYRIVWDDASEE